MIRALFILLLPGVSAWWLYTWLKAHPGITSISLGMQRFEMTTATLVLGILLLCIVFYGVIRLVLALLNLNTRLAGRYHHRMSAKASRNLTLGLMQLAEGHWDKAEQLLTEHVEHSDTPLLHYLIAARAAHMQHKPELRDQLLRQAIRTDHTAQVAVGVSQAEMQLNDRQLEQAHATLSELRHIVPRNSYVLKLYAKTLYQQESWDELFDLFPELVKHRLLDRKSKSMQKLQAAAIQGAFEKYTRRQQLDKLQTLWKKLPSVIKQQPSTILSYAEALHQAGADTECAAFIVKQNQLDWSPPLTELYGKIQHSSIKQATKTALQWLDNRPDNPETLLLLARLQVQQAAQTDARHYYLQSLNQAPHQEGYLELADLLESMGDTDNAAKCYRIGLRYAISQQGERLDFTQAEALSTTP